MSSYTEQETREIVHALHLLSEKGFPVPPEIFDAWCGACITVPIELAVLRVNKDTGKPEVLMVHREDKFFHGWHCPGTVILPGDTEESAVARLLKKEVGATVTIPQFVDRCHVSKGDEPYQNPRGQEVGNLFACFLVGEYYGRGSFFPLQNPPKYTLDHHKRILERVARWWNGPQR